MISPHLPLLIQLRCPRNILGLQKGAEIDHVLISASPTHLPGHLAEPRQKNAQFDICNDCKQRGHQKHNCPLRPKGQSGCPPRPPHGVQ